MTQLGNNSEWEKVDKSLNDCLTATIACKKEADRAKELAKLAQDQADEAQYWADKIRTKSLLFQEGAL